MQYPEAKTIHLVMDNLNIHRRKSLTDVFGVEVGTEIWDRFTVHYTDGDLGRGLYAPDDAEPAGFPFKCAQQRVIDYLEYEEIDSGTSTTVGFPAIFGWNCGRSRQSSTST
jgi:hypothetical protein